MCILPNPMPAEPQYLIQHLIPIPYFAHFSPISPAGEFIKYPSERRDVDTLKMWVKTLTGAN